MALTRKEMIRLLESGASPTRVTRLALGTPKPEVRVERVYVEQSCHRGRSSGHC